MLAHPVLVLQLSADPCTQVALATCGGGSRAAATSTELTGSWACYLTGSIPATATTFPCKELLSTVPILWPAEPA